MAQIDKLAPSMFFLDKKELQRIVAEQNQKMGFVPDPTATARKAQEMALALGIRPEDNLFSCGGTTAESLTFPPLQQQSQPCNPK